MTQQHNANELPQYPQSYWLASASLPGFSALQEDIQTDVAVVGAGMTGIAAAYLLAEQGVKVTLLDAGRILNGTTGHTTAKITAQHDLIYDELIAHLGQEQAKLYYEANTEALQWIGSMVSKHGISCGYTEEDAYVYTASKESEAKIIKEFEAYEKLGIPGSYVQQTQLPLPVIGAVVMNKQAQFHPLAFLSALVEQLTRKGVRIYEHTEAMTVEEDGNGRQTVVTSRGHKIHCGHVLSCTHFPFYGARGLYFAKLHAERSYVLAVKTGEGVRKPKGMYLSAEDPKRSIRTVRINGEELLLLGGENHQTGQGLCTIRYYEALQSFGQQYFDIQNIAYRWSAQDLISLDKLPYIGPATENTHRVLVATGYKKWGMTTSIAAAQLLSKQVTGQKSPYAELFRPSRFHADPSLRNLVVEGADVAKHFVKGKLEMPMHSPDELGNDEGGVVRLNGKRAGAYRDPQGKLHLVDTTCTHMGCEVEWNAGERSWDCPCHGSRFSYQGEVLEGPAKRPLEAVKETAKV